MRGPFLSGRIRQIDAQPVRVRRRRMARGRNDVMAKGGKACSDRGADQSARADDQDAHRSTRDWFTGISPPATRDAQRVQQKPQRRRPAPQGLESPRGAGLVARSVHP